MTEYSSPQWKPQTADEREIEKKAQARKAYADQAAVHIMVGLMPIVGYSEDSARRASELADALARVRFP